MREIGADAVPCVGADPRALLGAGTDIERLPEWNKAIGRVVDQPPTLTPGATWTTLHELDTDAMRSAYRTVNPDGHPSYADWAWEPTPVQGGAQVSVRWDVVAASLDALAAVVAPSHS
jgi:hypothetical protein